MIGMIPYIGYIIAGALFLFVATDILAVWHKKLKLQLIVSTALLGLLALTALYGIMSGQSSVALGIFNINPFSMLFVLLFSLSLMLVNFLAYEYSNDYAAFLMLLGFASIGMFAIAMANSLVTILLGIELMTVPTAFMIMLNGKQFVESAIKLFILAAIAISVLSFAVALVFPYDPSLALASLATNPGISGTYILVLALLLFITALSFDASLFPFNLWIPDVYTGAPGYVTALLAGINKKVAFVALFEVLLLVMFPLAGYYSSALQALAIMTMFFGNIVALVQNNVKRLFAYSSIAQAGYITLGIVSVTQYGIEASIFQIIVHSFMIIGSFAIVLWLESKNIRTITDYNGLGSRNAFAAFALTIFMISLIGIPPTAGFVGKFLLFTSTINVGLLALTIIAVINSFISVYYYAKVIMSMYAKKDRSAMKATWSINAVVLVCLAVVIVFGIFPQPLISMASAAATAIFPI